MIRRPMIVKIHIFNGITIVLLIYDTNRGTINAGDCTEKNIADSGINIRPCLNSISTVVIITKNDLITETFIKIYTIVPILYAVVKFKKALK